METVLEQLAGQYDKLEDLICQEAEKLESAGTDCTCDNRKEFAYIHHGNWDELLYICLNCGGFITKD